MSDLWGDVGSSTPSDPHQAGSGKDPFGPLAEPSKQRYRRNRGRRILLLVGLPILAFVLLSEVVNVVQRSVNSDSLERKTAAQAAQQGSQSLPQLGADAAGTDGARESAGGSASPPTDLPALIARLVQSTVLLECQETADTVSQGSGFALDTSALGSNSGTIIVTNWHVIQDCLGTSPVYLTTSTGATVEGVVAGVDEEADLALINAPAAAMRPLTPQTQVQQGGWVMAAGNPQGLTGTTTTGTVAKVSAETQEIFSDVLIAPGSSGGPLVNSAGLVIGVTSAVFSDSTGFSISREIGSLCRTLLTCTDG